jgi:hypothetical protein
MAQHNGSGNPEQLEAKLEHTRAEIDETLAAIEHKLTPGELLDETIDYLQHHGPGEFISNVAEQLREKPLPAALTAVGAAWATKRAAQLALALARRPIPTALTAVGVMWFMMEPRDADYDESEWSDEQRFARHDWSRPASRLRRFGARLREGAERRFSDAAETVDHMRRRGESTLSEGEQAARRATHAMSEVAGSAAHRVEETASHVMESASSAASTVKRAATEAFDVTREAARSAAESTGRAAHTAKEYTMRGRESTMRAAGELEETIRRHPLFTAMFLAAVGGVVAASLPTTRREEELLGDTRDTLANTAQGLADSAYETARQGFERGARVVSAAVEGAVEGAKERAAQAAGREGLDTLAQQFAGSQPQQQGFRSEGSRQQGSGQQGSRQFGQQSEGQRQPGSEQQFEDRTQSQTSQSGPRKGEPPSGGSRSGSGM